MDDVADRELVEDARRGSHEAAGALFDRHWARAWQVAFTLAGDTETAEDVVQDAFERAFAGLPEFNGRSSFGTWLYRIVVNRALNVRRSERRVLPTPDRVDAGASAGAAPPLADIVRGLPEERRTPIVLRYWLDYTPTEIAELLDVPVGTVHSRLARGLAQLRRHLEDDDDA